MIPKATLILTSHLQRKTRPISSKKDSSSKRRPKTRISLKSSSTTNNTKLINRSIAKMQQVGIISNFLMGKIDTTNSRAAAIHHQKFYRTMKLYSSSAHKKIIKGRQLMSAIIQEHL
jgi:hypothetical protein